MGLTKRETHSEILDRLHLIWVKKNAKYGDSATATYKKFGLLSYVIRINDKFMRFQSLVKNPDSAEDDDDESITDTLLDMANYAIMAVMDIETERQDAS